MIVFSASSNDLEFDDRLVPSFYYYTIIVKEQYKKKGSEYIRLGDYSTISDGEHSAIPRNSVSGVRYLYGRNIKEGVIDFDPISDDPFIYKNDYERFNRCHINQDDVLIAIYGTVGKSAVYKKEYIGTAGIPRHIANITLKAGAPITPEYLTAFFRSKYGKWQMFSLMTGNIQQLLSLKNLREFDVPLLPQHLMDQITAYEKEALQCEIKAQEKIKKAQEIFYKGLRFDVNSITRDFTFSVKYSELCEDNNWSTSYYDKLYVKMAKALNDYNGSVALGDIITECHGDEVGSENYKEFIDREKTDKPFIRTSDIVNNEVDLYPDYYVDESIASDITQDVVPRDIIFTKDGKVGCVGMITESDEVILSSGIERLRLNETANVAGLTQEYLFTALSIPEVGLYAAKRRTVIASTIPHLRVERMKEIEIPKMDQSYINTVTELVREAFTLKGKRKDILKESDRILEEYFIS